MKIDWNEYTGKTLHVTMNEKYGLAFDPKSQQSIFEIVFKTGRLINVYDEGLLLEQERQTDQENGNSPDNILIKIFIPYASIKCVEIFNL
jgi:hypothetical protein